MKNRDDKHVVAPDVTPREYAGLEQVKSDDNKREIAVSDSEYSPNAPNKSR